MEDSLEHPSPSIVPTHEDHEEVDANELEATELEIYQPHANTNTATHTHDDNSLLALGRFWSRRVSIKVPHGACRDHLGTL